MQRNHLKHKKANKNISLNTHTTTETLPIIAGKLNDIQKDGQGLEMPIMVGK